MNAHIHKKNVQIPGQDWNLGQRKFHKDTDKSWLEQHDQFAQIPDLSLSQVFSSIISVWNHMYTSRIKVNNSHSHPWHPKPCGKPSRKSWSCWSSKGRTDNISNHMHYEWVVFQVHLRLKADDQILPATHCTLELVLTVWKWLANPTGFQMK